jgi:hypothetical protein
MGVSYDEIFSAQQRAKETGFPQIIVGRPGGIGGSNNINWSPFGGGASIGGGGGGGGTSPLWATSTSSSQRTSSSTGGQRFADPGLAMGTANTALNLGRSLSQSYDDLVKNPGGSPMMQNAIAGVLAAAHPSSATAQARLSQLMGAAGVGGGVPTSYAGAAQGAYGSDAMRAKMATTSNLLATLFPSMAKATYAPIAQIPGVMDATKLGYDASGSQATSSTDERRPVFPPTR